MSELNINYFLISIHLLLAIELKRAHSEQAVIAHACHGHTLQL